jgi:hypothetical protein
MPITHMSAATLSVVGAKAPEDLTHPTVTAEKNFSPAVSIMLRQDLSV